ncbi:DUF4294 domain-containing protein [Tenacibaculum caenipelagi]|uniref:Uncharacterized protein DUF4294 n=1 Tax=Tenacibaculum caenipelagi TaxID=1325435 RepID=A0A4V3D3F9_9FLAO|nr:DUF4294 domain-containing protein [Tenacibaculum caenipelagi]TDQ29682.1 uncharacterized protein DUF4294 [Tenacibaculum caenipelagi]
MKRILYLYIILLATLVNGQIKDSLPNFNDEYFLIKKGDSLMIRLNEVTVLPKLKFEEKKDIHYYYWMRKKVFKAYPYAILAAKRVDSVNFRLSRIKSKRKKRQYVKRVQKYLENELTAPLKKLTRTEGRILLKLIHRQTGKTAFDNVKEIRSGWKAFWYNTTANMFKLSLKSEYKPETENEDYLIEDIIQRAYIDEKLEYQLPKLNKDYMNIISKSRGYVDVSDYKAMFSKLRKKRDRKQKRR